MRASVTRRLRFSGARRLASAALDEAQAARLYGRDAELHGRDFTLWVKVEGEVRPETGMVIDLKLLSDLVRQEALARLERSGLERSPLLAGRPATTENLAVAIFEHLETRLGPARLEEVELWEGADKGVRYRGER